MTLSLNQASQVALKAVETSASYLKEFNQDVLVTKHKDKVDFQLNLDLKAEEIIISTIKSNFPDHNILSEEIGFIDKNSEYTWVIDPLDGTRQYYSKFTLYGSTVSLENKRQLLTSALSFPAMNLTYHCLKGKSFLNQSSIKVSSQTKLEDSFVLTRMPYRHLGAKTVTNIFHTLNKLSLVAHKLTEVYQSNLSLCLVGQGFADAYVNLLPQRHWHDFAPGIVVAQNAGAKVTDREGKPIKLQNLDNGLVVSNGLIHDQLLEVIN